MSKITRALQKIFGGSLAPSGNIAQFGSLKAGSPAFTNDPAVIQALANYLQGWVGATIGNNAPPLQDRNAIDFLFSRQLAYLMQEGVPEWDPSTVYFKGGWTKSTDGLGTIYVSQSDNNVNHDPSVDVVNWTTFANIINPSYNVLGQAKAWVMFDGGPILGGTIYDSYNVSGVVRNSQGIYTISFIIPFATQYYAWSANSGPQNGGSITGGNNNHIIGDGAQIQGSIRICNYEPTGGPIGPEDTDRVWFTAHGRQ